ncbi:PH domain-containing protein [Patescibacteria group bacterium]|nr:PH domain-containing protein [Patescibacteria group bacterium]
MPNLNSFLFDRHLDDEEEVTEIVHKHWIFGVKYLFWPSLSFLTAWFLLYLAPFLVIFYISVIWSIASLVWLLRNFFDYYLDAWIITSKGIIDVEWHGWFHRESTRVLYSDIQGISYEINGIFSTLLRYGQVSVEKISTGNVVTLDYVTKPRRIESLILGNMELYLHSKNMKDAKHVQELLGELVAQQVQLQGIGELEYEDDDDDDEDYDDE